jgi:hypothetical protein
MAANPILALGIAAGLLWGAASYIRGRDVKRSILSAALVGMALGTPLHFLLVPGYAGWAVNQQLHRRLNRNWASFLVSLAGVPVFFGLLQVTGKIMAESYTAGTVGLGETVVISLGWGLIIAVLILAGCALYAVSSFAASFRRRRAQANH